MRKGRPTPTAPPSAQPGTAMILLPEPVGDPFRQAEQVVEKLRHEQPPRCVKTSKRKRKAAPRGLNLSGSFLTGRN